MNKSAFRIFVLVVLALLLCNAQAVETDRSLSTDQLTFDFDQVRIGEEKSSASLINPVFRCDVRAPESDKYLARLSLPGRPEFGDTLVLFGKAYAIDTVSVNWSGIVDGGLHQPDLIPCELTLL